MCKACGKTTGDRFCIYNIALYFCRKLKFLFMKKVLTMLSLVTVVTLSVNAQKTSVPQGKSLSIGLEAGLPTGDLADVESAGVGASVKAAFPVVKNGAVTGSVGYLSFLHKTDAESWNTVPVKVGFRYNVAGSGFNIEPQLGYTFGSVSGAESSDVSGFTWAIGAGYFFTKNIDLGVRYESASLTGWNANFVGFRLAYNFKLGGK